MNRVTGIGGHILQGKRPEGAWRVVSQTPRSERPNNGAECHSNGSPAGKPPPATGTTIWNPFKEDTSLTSARARAS